MLEWINALTWCATALFHGSNAKETATAHPRAEIVIDLRIEALEFVDIWTNALDGNLDLVNVSEQTK